jgi:hypothetical protein
MAKVLLSRPSWTGKLSALRKTSKLALRPIRSQKMLKATRGTIKLRCERVECGVFGCYFCPAEASYIL